MHDILIGFINDWSRKVMASKAFVLVQKCLFINKTLRYIYYANSIIMSCKYDETMIIVTKK